LGKRVSKRGTLLKSGYLSAVGLSSVKMVADRHSHTAYQALTTTFLKMSTLMTLNEPEP